MGITRTTRTLPPSPFCKRAVVTPAAIETTTVDRPTDPASSANTGTATAARYVRVVYYRGGTGATNGKYSLKLAW